MIHEGFRLHDIQRYHRNDYLKSVGRRACALLAAASSAFCIDLGYTLATEPDEAPRAEWVGALACKNADFAVPILNSTGKDVVEFQARNYQDMINATGGAVLETHYGTTDNVAEFRDTIDAKLAECATPERPYVPVIFNGLSLGGKYAQEVANAGLRNGIPLGIIMESSPTDITSIKDFGARALMAVDRNKDAPIPATKGMAFSSAVRTEFDRRGFEIFTDEQARFNITDSTEKTNAKTLTWQKIADARPWPAGLAPGDNTTTIDYIYSDADSVIDTALVRAQLKLFTRAEVFEHPVSKEMSWPNAPSHADGWQETATNVNEYRAAYRTIYTRYAQKIKAMKQATALYIASLLSRSPAK